MACGTVRRVDRIVHGSCFRAGSTRCRALKRNISERVHRTLSVLSTSSRGTTYALTPCAVCHVPAAVLRIHAAHFELSRHSTTSPLRLMDSFALSTAAAGRGPFRASRRTARRMPWRTNTAIIIRMLSYVSLRGEMNVPKTWLDYSACSGVLFLVRIYYSTLTRAHTRAALTLRPTPPYPLRYTTTACHPAPKHAVCCVPGCNSCCGTVPSRRGSVLKRGGRTARDTATRVAYIHFTQAFAMTYWTAGACRSSVLLWR